MGSTWPNLGPRAKPLNTNPHPAWPRPAVRRKPHKYILYLCSILLYIYIYTLAYTHTHVSLSLSIILSIYIHTLYIYNNQNLKGNKSPSDAYPPPPRNLSSLGARKQNTWLPIIDHSQWQNQTNLTLWPSHAHPDFPQYWHHASKECIQPAWVSWVPICGQPFSRSKKYSQTNQFRKNLRKKLNTVQKDCPAQQFLHVRFASMPTTTRNMVWHDASRLCLAKAHYRRNAEAFHSFWNDLTIKLHDLFELQSAQLVPQSFEGHQTHLFVAQSCQGAASATTLVVGQSACSIDPSEMAQLQLLRATSMGTMRSSCPWLMKIGSSEVSALLGIKPADAHPASFTSSSWR